jgi:hypothetical protein
MDNEKQPHKLAVLAATLYAKQFRAYKRENKDTFSKLGFWAIQSGYNRQVCRTLLSNVNKAAEYDEKDDNLDRHILKALSDTQLVAYYLMWCLIVDGKILSREHLGNYPMYHIVQIGGAVNLVQKHNPGYQFTKEVKDMLASEVVNTEISPKFKDLANFTNLHRALRNFYISITPAKYLK